MSKTTNFDGLLRHFELTDQQLRAASTHERSRIRLPVFGESVRDRKMRELFEDPLHGIYLLRNLDDYLFDFLDEEGWDPFDTTFSDIFRCYLKEVEEQCSKHGFDMFEHSDAGDNSEYCKECNTKAHRWDHWQLVAFVSVSWMAQELGEEEVSTAEEFEWHRDKCRLHRVSYNSDKKYNYNDAPSGSGVYYIRVFNRVKIGKSKNIAARIRDLATATPEAPVLLAFELGDADELEAQAHERWKAYRRHREWFAYEGGLAEWLGECLSVSK